MWGSVEMAKEPNVLLLNEHDEQYFLGPQSLVKGRIKNVEAIEAHRHDAAVFHGVFNLPVNCETLAKSGSEHGHQTAVFCWLNYCAEWYPELEFAYAHANGGSRGDTDTSRKIEGGKMKAEGVKRGVPDFFVPSPRFHKGHGAMYAGLYIEMKDASGGDGGSEHQHKYLEYLQRVGYAATIANGWREAIVVIAQYFEFERRIK